MHKDKKAQQQQRHGKRHRDDQKQILFARLGLMCH